MQDHRHGDVVRQVGHQSTRLGVGQLGQLQRVRVDDGQPPSSVRLVRGHGRRERAGEQRVDLDRHDPGTGLEQAKSQRAQTGPDLDHDLARRDAGDPHDPPNRVRIMQEVLAERLGRAHPELRRERTDLGRSEQAAQYHPFDCQKLHAPQGVLYRPAM